MEEVRIDLRIPDESREKEMKRSAELCFKINHTMPETPECRELIEDLFSQGVDKSTTINPPVFVLLGDKIKLGKGITLMNGFKCMSSGGLVILSASCASL